MKSRKRVITVQERPWASDQRYQFSLGTYVLEPISGLYFAEGVPVCDCERIGYAALLAPRPMLLLARRLGLTFTTAYNRTEGGHLCDIWGGWDFPKERFSPHIEIGRESLITDRLVPHLIHELGHLWWHALTELNRQKYIRSLLRSWSPDMIEVTEYAHDFFFSWQRSMGYTEPWAVNHQRQYLAQWTQEGFSETIACLAVPSYAQATTNVRLPKRRLAIAQFANLIVDPVPAGAIEAMPPASKN